MCLNNVLCNGLCIDWTMSSRSRNEWRVCIQWDTLCYSGVMLVIMLLLSVRQWTELADAAWYEIVGQLHLFARDRCCHNHWVPWHDKPQVSATSVCWWCSHGSAVFRHMDQHLAKTIQATLQLLAAVLAVLRAAEWPVGTSSAVLPWHSIYNRLIAQWCIWSTKVWRS